MPRGHPCLRQGFGRQARTMKIVSSSPPEGRGGILGAIFKLIEKTYQFSLLKNEFQKPKKLEESL